MRRCICHQHADSAKPDHSKLLSFQLAAGKSFFRFFCIFGNISVFLILLYPVDSTDDIAGSKKHPCQNQLFYAICVSPGRIKYNNSFFRTFFKMNIIYSCSCSRNCFQFFGKLHLFHISASDENGICFFRFAHRYILFCKCFQSYL